MIDGKRVIALTPLRGNSKSVKDKNLKQLGDKPLLAWPLEIAKKVPAIDRVLVSTDSKKIANAATQYGAEVYFRPDYLATDTALVIEVIKHLYETLKEEHEEEIIMVLLEATSPFRTPDIIMQCLQRLCDQQLDSIATFSEAEINPHRCWNLDEDAPQPFVKGAIPWLPRQKLPAAYQLNGAVYAFYPGRLPKNSPSLLFGKMGSYIMREATIDIDNEKDFLIANTLLQSKLPQPA